MPIDDALASETWFRFTECRDRGHLAFLEKADKCDNFMIGNQWTVPDKNTLALQRRPALTINKILSTVSTFLGQQIDNRSESLFRPADSVSTDAVAEALTKVWMQVAQNNQLPWARSEMFCDGLIRSRGFVDMRLDFTDNMRGEIAITNLNSKNVVIDPDAEEYDPDKWMDVFTTKWLCPQDIATLYSEEDAVYLKNKEGSTFVYGFDSVERVRDRFGGPQAMAGYYGTVEPWGLRRNVRVLDRQYRRLDKQLHFVDIKTGDMRAIPNTWDRDKIASVLQASQGTLSTVKKLIKRVRWTVTADNVVLHDDWSPYKHFTVVPYFPLFRYGHTVGVVENLLDPQELLNKVSSQELHVVNTTANSGWKVKAGALKNMSIEELEQKGATTGLVLELDDTKNADKITPNATPQGLDRISYKAEEHIKTISAVSDSMQGFDREDVAAKAIAYKTQRGAASMSKIMDNLERTDWILTRNGLDIIQEYYTEERLVTFTKSDATHETQQVTVNQLDETTGEILNDLMLGEYRIIITSTPARASMEDNQFEQIMEMREAGIQIPDRFAIEASRMQRKADMIKEMDGDKDSPEFRKAAERKDRADEAAVVKLEAEARDKMADTKLREAKAERELAMAATERAGLGAAASGEDPQAEAQAENDGIAQERELAMKEDKHAHEKDIAEREFALKADAHEHTKDLAQQKQLQDAAIARTAAFAKSRPAAQPTTGE